MMKELYQLFFYMPLLFLFGCSYEDDYLTEEFDRSNAVPAEFSLNDNSHDYPTRSSSDNSGIVLAEDTEYVSVSVEEVTGWMRKIASSDADTRLSWTTTANQVYWENGDQIGVFMRNASGGTSPADRSNVLHKASTTVPSSSVSLVSDLPIYFPDRKTNMKFYAYYPYSASANALTVNYTLPEDQSTSQSLASADVMCSTVYTANGASPNISLPFNHQMALLSFRIKGNVPLVTGILTKVVVSGTAITNKGTLDITTATLTPTPSATFAPYVAKNQTVGYSTTAYADIIINPCTIASNSGAQLTVTLYFGLTLRTTALVTNAIFQKGTRYIYNINVTLPV